MALIRPYLEDTGPEQILQSWLYARLVFVLRDSFPDLVGSGKWASRDLISRKIDLHGPDLKENKHMRGRRKTLAINSINNGLEPILFRRKKNGTPLTFSQRIILSNDYISDGVVLTRLYQKKLTKSISGSTLIWRKLYHENSDRPYFKDNGPC